MNTEPRLIVTCRTSSVELCEHEIGNVIFPRDPHVIIKRSKYSGVLFVHTTLDSARAYTIASHREYGFVENIIPVHCVLEYPPEETALRECLERIEKSRSVKLRVKSHGVRNVSKGLFVTLTRLLNSMGIVHKPESKECLYVEIFENRVYVGVGSCRPVFKASIRSR